MKTYFNKETKEWYNEGTTIVRKLENGVFMGYPTEEHLAEWGFEEYIPPVVEVIEESIDNDINEQEGNEPIVDESIVDNEPVVDDEPILDDEPTTDDENPEEIE